MKMTDVPAPKRGEFIGQNGYVYRLLHDDQGVEKNEDRFPLNTFNEVYLFIIAVAAVLTFLAEVVQMIAAFKELFG